MSFKTDPGGLAVAIMDAKLIVSNSASTWSTRLSQIGRVNGKITICTYALNDMEYITRILNKRSDGVTLIVNEAYRGEAEELEDLYPDLRVIVRPDVHAKMALLEPETVWIGSDDFGKRREPEDLSTGRVFEAGIGMHSKKAYDYYFERLSRFLGVEL